MYILKADYNAKTTSSGYTDTGISDHQRLMQGLDRLSLLQGQPTLSMHDRHSMT